MHFSTYNNYEHLSQSGDNNKHYYDHSNKITKLSKSKSKIYPLARTNEHTEQQQATIREG